MRSGTPRFRGGRRMRSGSAFSSSNATEVDRSMNSSSHRIWSRQQRLAEPVQRGDQDEAEQRDVGRDQEDEPLLDVVDDPPALGEAVHQGRERIVAEDQVGRLLGDARPRAHRDRDVGPVRAGASLTPSPVTATVRPAARATRTSRSFWSGVDRATTWRRGSSAVSRASSQVASSSPTTTCSRSSPAAAAMAAAVSGWSPVTTTTSMPGAARGLECFPDAVADRVGEADQGALDHPPPVRPAGAATATSRSPVAAFDLDQSAARRGASSGGGADQRRGRPPGAPIARSRSPSRPARLRVIEIGRPSTDRLRRRAGRSGRGSGRRRPPRSPAPSDAVNEPGGVPSARTQASSSARSASSRTASRAGPSTGPARSRTETTSSRLRVSVPVLSVMIRSIEPSVSSALSRRTRTSDAAAGTPRDRG